MGSNWSADTVLAKIKIGENMYRAPDSFILRGVQLTFNKISILLT